MDYTKNHHLPQWAASDRILMDDFNDAMKNIESAITTAQAAAAAAQSAADAAGRRTFTTGTYKGSGADYFFNLGYRPSFVFINGLGASSAMGAGPKFGDYSCATTGRADATIDSLEITNTGFTIKRNSANDTPPLLNEIGHSYEFIAFK